MNTKPRSAPLVTFGAIVAVFAAGDGVGDATYPAEVATLEFGHGTRLTDSNGLTLYQYETDQGQPGTSTCTDDCATQHPPLLVEDPSQTVPDGWSTIERDDGTRQWAYNAMPLYRYVRDSHKGAAYGTGDGWTVAFEPILTPAEMSIASTTLGQVLASSTGQTLYTRSGDGADSFDCDSACLESWQPFAAPWAAIDHGGFSVLAGADGVYQWAYRGQPLYLYSRDAVRGDTRGADEDWQPVILEPAPPLPEWVTIVASDAGTLYADADGITLHMFYDDRNAAESAYLNGSHCDEACIARYWDPVSASAEVPPTGHWSVVANGDDELQWAYRGRLVYTLKAESRPGELYYTTYRQFQHLKPIMHELPTLPGVF